MSYSEGVNSHAFKLVISGVVIILFSAWNSGIVFAATTGNNDVGIEFSREGESSSSEPATSSKYEIDRSTPTTKVAGHYPQTGELVQSVIYFLLGLLILVLISAIYFSKKSVERKSR